MKKSFLRFTAAGSLLLTAVSPSAVLAETSSFFQYGEEELSVSQIAQYDSMAGEGGTEIMAYDAGSEKAFITNGAEAGLDIVSFSSLGSGQYQQLESRKRIQVSEFGLEQVDDITSVAAHPNEDLIALSVVSAPKTDPGYVVFLTKDGEYIKAVQAGALPDMVTFTPDGTKLLAANEGEPSDDYRVDPEGSISIIDIMEGSPAAEAKTLSFSEDKLDESVRTSSRGTVLQQLEPEYITITEDSRTAYAALQENNAIAEINLETETIDSVKGLGVKDHSVPGNELDGVENGSMEIETLPLLGLYMPDAIDTFTADGQTYIVTPNEGDARDYEAYSEEVEIGDIIDSIDLNADHYEGYTQEELDERIENGLLEKMEDTEITAENGEVDGTYEALYSYGARSFSIFDAETMDLVYDSGSEIEEITAEALPEHFNTNNDELEFNGRSDAKGPEPETTVTGEVDGTTYAFTALERFSAVMVYDITDPADASFVTMMSSRDFSEDIAGDVAPEGLTFISASDSSTGEALLAATHEMSGTIAVYELSGKTGENGSVFQDIDKDYWAYPHIKELQENGIVTGRTDGTFAPSEEVTRAQFAVMLSRALDLEQDSDRDGVFEDVPEWAADEVKAVYEAGIATGKTNGRFVPQDSITREQMAAMLVRAYEYQTGETAEAAEISYNDRDSISSYAHDSVEKAAGLEWMTGTGDGMFQPKEASTRAQAAKVISMLKHDLEE
ncbi:choice-of-anchor I family protein [Salibacterium aidingense]|uniref:choice-of-anchor I family protein n=1 Tax=Salibacterium aidingense TaxID=384933 RepID=UPI00040356F9|nr:choice-of-anchor I family protein [Salibacterium aidingense]